MINEKKLILYKDEEGKLSVSTRFADEDVWLTQVCQGTEVPDTSSKFTRTKLML